MDRLANTIRRFVLNQCHVQRLVVAFSGGLDSTVLLHAALNTDLSLPVVAIHVNHQLSPNADAWQIHCKDTIERLGVASICQRVKVNPTGRGLEEAAREARYAAIAQHLQDGDLLLTGHHLQDQAETLLLRLARGSGLRGLSAMKRVREFGAGRLGRPLLGASKAELQAYADTFSLCWIEDETNHSQQFDRNHIRHSILPMFSQRWPKFDNQLGQTAELLQEADALLDDYASEDLATLHPRQERVGCSIELSQFERWSAARRNHVVRRWLQVMGYRAPAKRQFDEFENLLRARRDQNPVLLWGDCELRRFQQRLYCLPVAWSKPQPRQPNDVKQPFWQPWDTLTLADGSLLSSSSAQSGLDSRASYRIDFRTGGERCHPYGREHSQTLKKLLQEHQLEPWLRDRIPLLYQQERTGQEQLAAVGDLWVEANCWCRGEGAVAVSWHYPAAG